MNKYTMLFLILFSSFAFADCQKYEYKRHLVDGSPSYSAAKINICDNNTYFHEASNGGPGDWIYLSPTVISFAGSLVGWGHGVKSDNGEIVFEYMNNRGKEVYSSMYVKGSRRCILPWPLC
ncbi:MAG: hypothetical protein HRT87_11040 [Legionellales bacterium]|nr:hypothetical protein [Legionellales bacterium]